MSKFAYHTEIYRDAQMNSHINQLAEINQNSLLFEITRQVIAMEKEPQFREAKEAPEKEPKQPAPGTSPTKSETEVAPPSPTQEVREPIPETDEVSVAFAALPQLVGKNILFRDPEVTTAADDPPYKHGTIERRNGKFVIVVERGRYYPYYTGWSRQNIFALRSQSDISGLRVKLDK